MFATFNLDFLDQQKFEEASAADVRNFAIAIIATFATGYALASTSNFVGEKYKKIRNKTTK